LHTGESALLVRGSAGSAVVVGIIPAWFRKPKRVRPPMKGGVKNAFAALKTLRIAQWLKDNNLGQVPGCNGRTKQSPSPK